MLCVFCSIHFIQTLTTYTSHQNSLASICVGGVGEGGQLIDIVSARIFLLVDLREFFFRFRVEGTKK